MWVRGNQEARWGSGNSLVGRDENNRRRRHVRGEVLVDAHGGQTRASSATAAGPDAERHCPEIRPVRQLTHFWRRPAQSSILSQSLLVRDRTATSCSLAGPRNSWASPSSAQSAPAQIKTSHGQSGRYSSLHRHLAGGAHCRMSQLLGDARSHFENFAETPDRPYAPPVWFRSEPSRLDGRENL